MKILLVEDNPLTAKGIMYLLEREHYDVSFAENFAAALSMIASHEFDLSLLDVSLPDGEGYDLAGQIRAKDSNIALIFLTARDNEEDVVRGLELGADDYITKPFRNRELLLRIRNVLARRHLVSNRVQVGNVEFDYDEQIVRIDGAPVELTALERKLLGCLLENSGRIVSRERLLDEIYSAYGRIVNDNTLSVYLKRLREKLGQPGLIQTVKSLGYRFKGNK